VVYGGTLLVRFHIEQTTILQAHQTTPQILSSKNIQPFDYMMLFNSYTQGTKRKKQGNH